MQTYKKNCKQHYKANPPPAGVYLITNTENGRRLLGVSSNIPGRFNRYRLELNAQTCRNSLLMTDWKVHGEHKFTFEILDTANNESDTGQHLKANLDTLLSLWQEQLPCCEYNSQP